MSILNNAIRILISFAKNYTGKTIKPFDNAPGRGFSIVVMGPVRGCTLCFNWKTRIKCSDFCHEGA